MLRALCCECTQPTEKICDIDLFAVNWDPYKFKYVKLHFEDLLKKWRHNNLCSSTPPLLPIHAPGLG
jgi:hypothetical protein